MTTHLEAKPAGTPTWIDHASPDAEAARTFYHAVFGWQYDIGGPEYGGYTTARLGERTATLAVLAQHSEREILALHGVGPKTIPTLRQALDDAGLVFAKQAQTDRSAITGIV